MITGNKSAIVSLFRDEGYGREAMLRTVRRHFEALGGIENLIPVGARVVIKPNLVSGEKPERAVTVHPDLVWAVVELVKTRTSDITIAESPGGPHSEARLKAVYRITGLSEIDCRKVYEPQTEEISFPEGVKCRSFPVIREIAHAEVLISLAKLKTHGMMAYTGAVKNLFGAVFALQKAEYHFRFNNRTDFSDMILDLCLALRPTVSIIDGIMGMEGEGPTGGTPKAACCTIASLNPFAADVVGAALIGIDEHLSGQLERSYARGLTPGFENITIVGDSFDSLKTTFALPKSLENTVSFGVMKRLPSFIRRPLERTLAPLPSVIAEKCVGCGKCAASCPQKTIHIKEGKAKITVRACIRCYCCQELCPEHAVEIKSRKVYGIRL